MRIGVFVYFIPEGSSGGVQQYSQQLIYALSKYAGLETKVFCSESNKNLFKPYESKNLCLVVLPKRCKYVRALVNNRIIRKYKFLSFLSEGLSKNKIFQEFLAWLGDYKKIVEDSVDVIHFPYQTMDRYDFNIPTIISLHDVQHKYFPKFFSKKEIKNRDIYFKKSAELCKRIMVSFAHVKEDLVKFYGINPDKIDVCGLGYDKKDFVDVSGFPALQKKYNIQGQYVLYPSVTWMHKNHIRLLRAVKIIHENGKKIHLVCTGKKNDYYEEIKKEIDRLELGRYVVFTGFLPEIEFDVILKKAELMAIPTLYEAESIPLIEAMAFGVPVVCSNATVLPEQIGDERFVFDAFDESDMAQKILQMLNSEDLIRENLKNSSKQIENLKWEIKINNFIESYKKSL